MFLNLLILDQISVTSKVFSNQPTIVTTIPSEQIHANERSYVNFSKKDLKILALDLRAKEFQIRSRFTPTFIVLELVKKGSSGSLKLSNNSSEVIICLT